MEISQTDRLLRPEQSRRSADVQFQEELEHRLNDLKADVAKQPFLWLAIVFIAGVVSHTFPARMLFLVVVRIVSWLLGPALLLMGVLKLTDLFRRNETSILHRP